mgnify:CR=1 FL=1
MLRPHARADGPAGVLLVLHGSGGNGVQIREMLGRRLEPLAAASGYAVVYPDGFERHWNDCRGAASYAANRRDIDDPAFLRAIVAAEGGPGGSGQRPVFAIGFSNGGQMVLRLALEDAARYAALAVISANLPVPQGRDCGDAAQTAPIVFFAGTADPINPFHGGVVRIGQDVSRGYVLDAAYTAQWFATRAGHASPPRSVRLPDLDPRDGSRATRLDWSAAGGPPVRLYVLEDAGHTIPGSPDGADSRRAPTNRDIDAAAEAWAFFLAARRAPR